MVFKQKPEYDAKSKPSNDGVLGEIEKKFFQFTYGDGLIFRPYIDYENISLNLNLRAKTKQFDLGPYTINL